MGLVGLTLSALPLQPVHAQPPTSDVNSLGLSATYDVNATFGWNDREVSVDAVATVSNPRPWSTRSLAFNLSTLRTGHAEISVLTVDGTAVQPTIDDQTIIVSLAQPLRPGEQTVVRIVYGARLNAAPRADSDEWGFARTADLLTAYRWIPWLSRTTPFDRPSVGDPFVTTSSPHVAVSISVDRSLVFATSGVGTRRPGLETTFEARNVRDFNLAASPDYVVSQREVRGTLISFFHRAMAPEPVLDAASKAFAEFSDKIGGYPYPQLTIAEVGPWAPLESPAHFWMPSNAPARLVPWMTAHETGHQWFYAVVGNDQARDPFADEALTDFIARDLIGRFVPSKCRPDDLDQSIYDLGECYPWVTYVQGVAYLKALRERIGGNAFWRGVADYYAEYRFGIGSTRALLLALDRAAGQPERHEERFPRLWPVPVICLPLGL